MPIYKMEGKKNGRQKYRVRINYTDSNGKAKQLDRVAYGSDEAKELERQLMYNLKNEVTRMTFEDLYKEYLSVRKSEIREATMDRTKRTADIYILPFFKNTRIDKINVQLLQKWKTYINDCKTSDNNSFSLGYKQKIYSILRAILNYAVKMEHIDTNPISKLGNFTDVNAIKTSFDYYTPDEFIKFISEAYNSSKQYEKQHNNIQEWNYYVFFNIAFYTGMRKGEIYALKWTDIKDNTIHITRSITQKIKGGDRETPPKNKSSIRTVQIPIPLKKVLDEHYNRYKQIKGFDDDYRICGGIQCIRDTSLKNKNEQYAKAAKVKHIRVHDFRHSHASLLANNGINIQEIARRLGHSKVELTWNTYSHLYPQEAERALKILNKIV